MNAVSPTQTLDAELGGVAPLPRSNGELVFAEPWESRAFGMAVGLHEQGLFAWDEFRRALIERIGAWESSNTGEPYVYYEHWLGALEDVLTQLRPRPSARHRSGRRGASRHVRTTPTTDMTRPGHAELTPRWHGHEGTAP